MPLPGRLHQPDGGVGGDGGVDGVAAALEDLHAGARRERLARGDDAERGRHDRAAHDLAPAAGASRSCTPCTRPPKAVSTSTSTPRNAASFA